MKFGDVLRKERLNVKLSAEQVAERLGIPKAQYEELEGGTSPAERWAPILAKIAIKLETPTSRLVAESGRFADARPSRVGSLIRKHREEREKTVAFMAKETGASEKEYVELEAGQSPLEQLAPLFLGFAEVIEQPVFNLFYPCGLPFEQLKDYP
jgi:transcriptional regulator with XRE-family HTH domain